MKPPIPSEEPGNPERNLASTQQRMDLLRYATFFSRAEGVNVR